MNRYRTALELQFGSGIRGLRRPENAAESKYWGANSDMMGGIPDVGWRTFIGSEYLTRLPNLADAKLPDGVTMSSQDHLAVLTAGSAPIRGDMNKGEDISAYTAIADALIPVSYPKEIAYDNYFGNLRHDLAGRDRLDAYFSRLRG